MKNDQQDTDRRDSIPGMSFNAPVTFNAPMFDIHDNTNVYIGQAPEREAAPARRRGGRATGCPPGGDGRRGRPYLYREGAMVCRVSRPERVHGLPEGDAHVLPPHGGYGDGPRHPGRQLRIDQEGPSNRPPSFGQSLPLGHLPRPRGREGPQADCRGGVVDGEGGRGKIKIR